MPTPERNRREDVRSQIWVGLLVGLSLLAACSRPDESEAIERLTATEAAALPVIEAAVGPQAVTVWKRNEGPVLDPFCTFCTELTSRMNLGAPYTADVLDRFADAALALGADAGPVRTATSQTTRDGVVISNDVLGWSRLLSLGGDVYSVQIHVDAKTQELFAFIVTGPFRVEPFELVIENSCDFTVPVFYWSGSERGFFTIGRNRPSFVLEVPPNGTVTREIFPQFRGLVLVSGTRTVGTFDRARGGRYVASIPRTACEAGPDPALGRTEALASGIAPETLSRRTEWELTADNTYCDMVSTSILREAIVDLPSTYESQAAAADAIRDHWQRALGLDPVIATDPIGGSDVTVVTDDGYRLFASVGSHVVFLRVYSPCIDILR